MIPNEIFNMKMKIYKPLHSYPNLTYKRWVLVSCVTHVAKVEVTNPFGSMGQQAEKSKGV